MRKILFIAALYLSLIPLIGASAFAFGYGYSAGVELYYFNNPVDELEEVSDYSEPANAEYFM